jgi:hypothetical protein
MILMMIMGGRCKEAAAAAAAEARREATDPDRRRGGHKEKQHYTSPTQQQQVRSVVLRPCRCRSLHSGGMDFLEREIGVWTFYSAPQHIRALYVFAPTARGNLGRELTGLAPCSARSRRTMRPTITAVGRRSITADRPVPRALRPPALGRLKYPPKSPLGTKTPQCTWLKKSPDRNRSLLPLLLPSLLLPWDETTTSRTRTHTIRARRRRLAIGPVAIRRRARTVWVRMHRVRLRRTAGGKRACGRRIARRARGTLGWLGARWAPVRTRR